MRERCIDQRLYWEYVGKMPPRHDDDNDDADEKEDNDDNSGEDVMMMVIMKEVLTEIARCKMR